MTPTQATVFASKWSVVTQYTDPVTGVSATVFQEIATGKRTLAIRGTGGLDDAGVDIDIAAGLPLELNLQYIALKTQVQTWLGNGTLAPGFTVSGHSLGGYLAVGLEADFSASIGQAWLYNAPGLNGVLGSVTGAILAVFGITAPVDPSKIFNLKADAGISPIAGLGAHVAPAISIHIEDQSFSDVPNPPLSYNHSQRVLTDSLALYAAYAQLDPTASVTAITKLIKASSNRNVNTLELALDNLRELLLGATIPGTVPEGRESYYTNLYQLTDWLTARASSGTAPTLKIDALTSYGGTAIAAKAQANTPDGLAYRYAIATLNPFAITGDASLYASHNAAGELDLYDPATGTGNLTAQYLKDRAAMLSWKMKFDTGAPDSDDPLTPRADKPYSEEWDSWSISGDWDLIDQSSGIKLAIDGVDLTTFANHQIVFGTKNADSLTGDKLRDNLYGGAGADTLTGNGGSDYLEGGAGNDTYLFNPGDGTDTVLDTDGLGVIKFGAISAQGSTGIDPAQWIHTAGTDTWMDQQNGITYTRSVVNGETRLLLKKGDNNVLVKGWSEGELGIELGAGTPAIAPVTDLTLMGDLQPVDFNATEPGVQASMDDLGNVIVGDGAAPGREDTLYDSTGNDRIQGLAGNDRIIAWRGGDDLIEGGAGSDILDGGLGNDHIHADTELSYETAYILGETQAGTGQRGDLLFGAGGNDTLIGEAGNDIIMGGTGKDAIMGLGGDDTIEGDADILWTWPDWRVSRSVTEQGGNVLYTRNYSFGTSVVDGGTDGDDDVIYGGAGNDWIFAGGGNDFVDGGADDDVVFGDAGNDVILGQGGNDVLVGDGHHSELDASLHGDDYLSGGAGNDKLWGAGGADYLDGGDGDDVLAGDGEDVPAEYEGDDVLDGGAGNDVLYGGGGNDILMGGPGNDMLFGGKGDDTYLDVDEGDVIGDVEGHSTIVLARATGVSTDVSPSVAPTSDSTLGIALDDGSTLSLQGALYGMDASIQFANGEEFDLETWVSGNLTQSVALNLDNFQLGTGEAVRRAYGGAGADQIQGSSGNDSIKGYGGNDQLFGYGGDDVLDGGDGSDHLQGGAGNDTLLAGSGNDSLLGESGNDLLDGGDGDDELQGGLGGDALNGGNGNDTLFGQEGNDILDGGRGNDILLGNAGDDTYLFNLGDGQDVIWEEGDSVGDVLKFGAGIAPADILVARSGSDLVLAHVNGVDEVSVANWYLGTPWQLARFEFADGTAWSAGDMSNAGMLLRGTSSPDAIYGGSQNEILIGLDGNDQLYGNGGNDTLVGGKGNDTLTGGAGADTYLFALGDGADAVDSDTTDTLRFAANISSTDIAAERVGADLILRHQNGTDSVKILNWYGSANDQLQQVVFNADGTTWSASTVSQMGVNYGNQYTCNLGDGAKAIEDWGGVDSLTFGDGIAASDIAVARVGQDLRLSHVNGSDQTTIKGWFTYADGSAWVEEVRFADGTVWSAEALTTQALTQVGTDGNDTLYGIDNFGDTLRGGDGNDNLYGYSGDDLLEGGAGNDSLFGGAGNDTLVVGPDGGYADGGAGNDLYLYAAGDGDLSVSDSSGSDTLRFGAGIRIEDAQFQKQYDGLSITLADGGRIRINYWFNGYDRLVERFEFADGTTLTADQISSPLLVQQGTTGNDILHGTGLDDTLIGAAGDDTLQGGNGNDLLLGDQGQDQLYGGNGDDSLRGGEGHDQLYGEAGNDDLNSGAGNDWLIGGAGDDSYRDIGQGQDRILDSAGLDSLYFASDIRPEDLIVSRINADLRIGFVGRDDSVTLLEWFKSPRNSIERFIFADGSQWSAANIDSAFSLIGGNGSLTGSAGDDLLYGGAGQDTLQGGAGNDLLDGVAGSDTLVGGAGDDTYIADSDDTLVELPGEGIDTLVWTGSAAVVLQNGLENLVLAESAGYKATGNAADNRIIGNSQSNSVDGGAGADILEGGLGSDDYYVDNPGDLVIERINEGDYDRIYASISYALPEHVENLILDGNDAINGYGNELDNYLSGNDAANLLVGGGGNDTLSGGLGADTLMGGSGDDYYILDGYDDLLVEGDGEGFDRILINQVSAEYGNTSYRGTFTMADNIEKLTMTGWVSNASLYGNAQDNVIDARGSKVFSHQSGYTIWYYHADVDIYGGAGNDIIYGSDGGSTLDGGLGDDVMYGGIGRDSFYVDSVLDQVIENASSSSDSVYSTITYTLGVTLENLYLLGNAHINGTGNDQNNYLTGNDGNNVLIGGAGDDRIDGGGGNDTLIGGTGNDTYVLSSSGLIIEQANEGIDRVESSISYSLDAHLENLILTGSAAIDGTGNELDNLIQGNYANNKLVGGAGNDILDGGVGNDTMLGGTGDDSYYVDSNRDVVTEYANEGIDSVSSSVAYTLGNNLENLTLTGNSAIRGTGNALDNRLTGNAASNTLTGGAGNDWIDGAGGADKMLGGTGDDTYVVDVSTDIVTERSNEGTDMVLSSATCTLSANVENLTLTGTEAINGSGNALDNVLVGNSAANTLSGGAGNDTLDGMGGADILAGGNGNDTYIMGRGYGTGTIVESDASAGNTDIAQFLSGVAADQIWFSKTANNLEVSVIGTADKLVIQDWYLGDAYRVEQFKTTDGARTLTDSNVENLVNAMASFAPPAAGQTTLPQNYQDSLAGVIAANWQ